MVQFLLGMGISPDVRDNLDQTPATIAKNKGHDSIVGLLEVSDAQVSDTSNGAESQKKQIAEFILENFFYEIGKDGKIDPEERDALNHLYKMLEVDEEVFFRAKDKAKLKISQDRSLGTANYSAFLDTIGWSLRKSYGPQSTKKLLIHIAKGLNCIEQFHSTNIYASLPPDDWAPLSEEFTQLKWQEFYLAVRNGDLETVTNLLSRGMNPDFAVENGGFTPLMTAIVNDETEIFNLILKSTSDFEFGDSDCGFTALAWAVRKGRESMVRDLLRYGSDPDHYDKFGISLVNMAYSNGSQETMFYLLINACTARNAKELQEWKTWASENGWVRCVELLDEKLQQTSSP